MPQQLHLYDPVSMNLWWPTDKGDMACRTLADRHYTRQSHGAPMWTRPGYNFVLTSRDDEGGTAAWCWWRPKWEAGIGRKDGLQVLECTLFRNETRLTSSLLIVDAVEALSWPEAQDALALSRPWHELLVTAVNGSATARRRSQHALPGQCFRHAGWTDFAHTTRRANCWLQYRCRNGQ